MTSPLTPLGREKLEKAILRSMVQAGCSPGIGSSEASEIAAQSAIAYFEMLDQLQTPEERVGFVQTNGQICRMCEGSGETPSGKSPCAFCHGSGYQPYERVDPPRNLAKNIWISETIRELMAALLTSPDYTDQARSVMPAFCVDSTIKLASILESKNLQPW